MQQTQTQMGDGLTVDSIMWNSGTIKQRIQYASSVLPKEQFPIIFSQWKKTTSIKGWKQLPLGIRRKIQGTQIRGFKNE